MYIEAPCTLHKKKSLRRNFIKKAVLPRKGNFCFRSANVEKIFMGVSLLPVTRFFTLRALDLVSSFDYKKLIIKKA